MPRWFCRIHFVSWTWAKRILVIRALLSVGGKKLRNLIQSVLLVHRANGCLPNLLGGRDGIARKWRVRISLGHLDRTSRALRTSNKGTNCYSGID